MAKQPYLRELCLHLGLGMGLEKVAWKMFVSLIPDEEGTASGFLMVVAGAIKEAILSVL